MRKEYGELFVSIALMIISAFPLFDLLSNITNITNISDFSLVVVIVMLIVILISSIIYFISYWTEKFNQLHFKGAGYTVPEIYQVRGLHNSSSLYKITNGYQTTPYNSIKQRNYLKINHLGQKEKERQIVGDNGMV